MGLLHDEVLWGVRMPDVEMRRDGRDGLDVELGFSKPYGNADKKKKTWCIGILLRYCRSYGTSYSTMREYPIDIMIPDRPFVRSLDPMTF